MFLPCELIITNYLVTSGENVRASRYLIVTLSLGQSTSPFAPANNEIRKNRGHIKLHKPTIHTYFILQTLVFFFVAFTLVWASAR